jgi:hypothetical protein
LVEWPGSVGALCWRPRDEALDTDDEIIGYQPIVDAEDQDALPFHCSITTGRFLRSGGWERCTMWAAIPEPGRLESRRG